MKVISKRLLRKKNNIAYMKSERDILTKVSPRCMFEVDDSYALPVLACNLSIEIIFALLWLIDRSSIRRVLAICLPNDLKVVSDHGLPRRRRAIQPS